MPILVGDQPPPPDPPGPEPEVREEPTLIWRGWTAAEWVLAGDRYAGTFIEQDGLGGLLEPAIQYYFSENAGDGSTYQGHRIPARSVQVPIFVWAETSTAMRAEDARFRKTLRPEREIVLLVVEPSGAKRSLTLKYLSGAEGAFSGSTYGKHWMRYTLTLTALDPFFYGQPESQKFEGVDPVDFYNGGTAPAYIVSETNTLATATITNIGDEPTYVTWTVHGAMTEFTGGWPGGVIHLPVPLQGNESITVYTDPRDGRIIDGTGASRWGDVVDEDIEFGPLPASQETELNLILVAGDANSYVEVSWVPKFRSAW